MPPRNTTVRDRHRQVIARNKPPCGICGGEIDYSLPHLDPGEYVVDHVIPLAKGGRDVLENKTAAHRACNRAKSDKPAAGVDSRVRVAPLVSDWEW